MKLPLPTYLRPGNAAQLIEAVSMFVNQIDEAIKTLITETNMRFYGKSHLIQMVAYTAGLFMGEESFKDVEQYLGAEGVDALLRDFGAHHG